MPMKEYFKVSVWTARNLGILLMLVGGGPMLLPNGEGIFISLARALIISTGIGVIFRIEAARIAAIILFSILAIICVWGIFFFLWIDWLETIRAGNLITPLIMLLVSLSAIYVFRAENIKSWYKRYNNYGETTR